MKHLVTMFASIVPEDEIIEKIQEKITEYKITKNKEAKDNLIMYYHLLCTKEIVDREGVTKVMNDMENLDRLHNTFKNNVQ